MSTDDPDYETDPYLLTVLSKKAEMITREMTQTLLKSARSGVINSARDFSSAITLYDGRQFMIDEGLPMHLGNVHLVPRKTLELFDDVSPGDCFLTNTPYAGSTHHADYTLHAPVFVEGEPLFWTVNRAHQADVGAPEPSTYVGDAKTIYEEGPHFPSVRIQEGYEDREDIVRTCKLNIRSGETQWFGDYLAQVGAVRTGEEKLQALCEEYGVDTIRQFSEDWIAYGEEIMRSEIEKLPRKSIEYTAHHDPIPDVAPEGIPVTVSIEIRPGDARISVDLTDNVDNIPAGFNLSEATTTAAVYAGIFKNLGSNVPHNHGSIGRIDIEMAEGKVVGKPEYPVGTSLDTTNVAAVLTNAMQAAFGELGEPYGMAEGNAGVGASEPVVSGTDFRDGDEYVNELIFATGGGPAVYGHDGWLAHTIVTSSGVIQLDSVEIDEQNFPILVERYEFTPDSGGAGRWRGSPGTTTAITVRGDRMMASYFGTGKEFPPNGILGGESGGALEVYRTTSDGDTVELPVMAMESVELDPGESLVCRNPGGGGYGDPYERPPEQVVRDVRRGYVTEEGARVDYGVVVDGDGDDYRIDDEETRAIRGSRDGGE